MKPPICSYCGSRFSPSKTGGTTLKFAITAEEEASNQWMRDNRRVGHPKGLHWICETHIAAAEELTHLHWPEARAKMEKDIELSNNPKARNLFISWFQRFFK